MTETGKQKVKDYIAKLAEKRKEILDAGLDTAKECMLPTEAMLIDIIKSKRKEKTVSFSAWGITDYKNCLLPITFTKGVDYK